MMMRLTALLTGVLAFASLLPVPARADSGVQIGNLEKKPLNFSLRCAGGGDWHTFSLNSLDYKWYDASSWNGNCGSDRYELRIGTRESDGSVMEKTLPLVTGQSYALVKQGTTNAYYAYDIRRMVVVANKSSRQLTFHYGCSGVAQKTARVSSNDFIWIYAGDPAVCSPYQASVDTTGNDGSTTTITRPMALQNIYLLSWNDTRQAWDIQETKQGGGPAARSDAN